MVRKKGEIYALQHLSSVFFFIVFAALLWIIIKLSAIYTVTEPLTINLKDNPSDLIITDGTQSQLINVTLSASGFDLLNYYFRPNARRNVDISLEEVPLHHDGRDTYSFGSRYVIEKIAELLNVEIHEVNLNEDKIYLNMQELESKVVKILPNIDINYEKQFNRHGKIQITPDSITLYGPKEKLAKVDNVYTDKISLREVNSNIDIDVPLHYDEAFNTNTKSVNLKINVERYTEAEAYVPILNNSTLKIRFFPDKIKVKYIVSLTDYNIINENSFIISIDTADVNNADNFLPIYLTDYPSNTKITSLEPKHIEYIIIEDNEN